MNEDKRVNDIEYATGKNFRNYNLCLDKVPRLAFDDPNLDSIILQRRPVIITGTNLVEPASKWTLDYLQSALGNCKVNVMISKDHNFMFHNDKPTRKNSISQGPRTKRILLKFSEFLRRLREWKPGDDRLYLQDHLGAGIEPCLLNDFQAFNWNWINRKQEQFSWGDLTANLLLLAMEGNVTRCHFDEQHNFFAQVHGYKRCILFPPSQFECLYPYPLYHPCDRQSQVYFENPDFERFPKFKEIEKGMEAIVGPGDVLYIPDFWFHQVESMIDGGHTLSINFWYKNNMNKETVYPLKDFQKVIISRNIEKMLLEILRDPNEVGSMLKSMTLGRYS